MVHLSHVGVVSHPRRVVRLRAGVEDHGERGITVGAGFAAADGHIDNEIAPQPACSGDRIEARNDNDIVAFTTIDGEVFLGNTV